MTGFPVRCHECGGVWLLPECPDYAQFTIPTTLGMLFRAHAQMQAARPSAANWRDQHGDVTP